ncbi:MAG: aminotransferase class I/II-fold pyridoxal phosphate-dependent enzyme [Planctomycetes bacterium]|nr:aminotransferase class I/II-fold pyridoxal phosphate-dependent enzyme [Planctomycetota bacterium]
MAGLVPNARSRRVPESATLAASAQAARMRAAGRAVVSLVGGDRDPSVVETDPRAPRRPAFAPRLLADDGPPELRAAAARWFAEQLVVPCSADEVMVCAGTEAALHLVLATIVEPGDPVLLLAPHEVSFPDLVALADGNPVVLPAEPAAGFLHDGQTIAAAVEECDARGIVLNFPNRPSGAMPSRAQVQAIVDVAVEHDLWLLSDEGLAALHFGAAEHVSPAALPGGRERTVVVGNFPACPLLADGARTVLAGPRAFVEACCRIQSHLLGGSPAARDPRRPAVGRPPSADRVATRLRALDERRRLLVAGVREIPGLAIVPPSGGCHALVDVRELAAARGLDDAGICAQLLDGQLLAAVPGSAFGVPGFVRLGFAVPMDELREALRRLRTYAEGK